MPVLFEISKRYSTSVAGIALALLGVPLALTAHRKETSIGFALSVIIAFAYFLLMIFIETFKHDAAAYPHLLIWLPNVLFIGLGCWLFWRRMKN
jgi:lipopolysaccharide export system permease protein